MCNYDCSYCEIGYDKTLNKNNFIRWEILKIACDNIISLNKNLYNICLLGGEPSIHPDLKRIIAYLGDKLSGKVKLSVLTNGSSNIEVYNDIADYTDNINIPFELIITLHFERCAVDRIITFLDSLSYRKSFKITLNILAHPDYFSLVKSAYEKLTSLYPKYRFMLKITPVRDLLVGQIDPRYTEEYLSWIKKSSIDIKGLENLYPVYSINDTVFQEKKFYDFIDSHGNRKIEFSIPNKLSALDQGYYDWKNLYCCAGVSLFHILPDGNCIGGSCGLFKGNYINIYEKHAFFKQQVFPMIVNCTKTHCLCSANYVTPKFRSKEEAESYIELFKFNSIE